MKLHSLAGLAWFLTYLGIGMVMLYVFQRIYTWLTPWDEDADMAAGKVEPMLVLAAAKLGFVLPLCVASYQGGATLVGVLDYIAWGTIAACVQLIWFKVWFMVWM